MPRLRGRKFTGLSLIEQQHVLHLVGEHTALDGGTDGDHLVGADVLAEHVAEVPKTANAAESNQIK